MKNFLASLILMTSAITANTASAHHMAEGIVSDDIWQMIDDLLVAADSPHLDLDFTTMGTAIITTVEVDSSMAADILMAIAGLNNGRLLVATQATEAGMTAITIVETIGSGESQVVYQ
jgi:hypothetical protein